MSTSGACPLLRRAGASSRASAYRERVPVSCDYCGASVSDDVPPLTWSLAVEQGRTRRYCDQCTRANLRAMEGKLDAGYW